MNEIIDKSSNHSRPIRIAIVGNSNSIMRDSYCHDLAAIPGVNVTNRSLGGTPCVLLLDFLALEKDLDFDFVIIDTAIGDVLLEYMSTVARARETLEIFISSFRARSNAQIIILNIPTRMGLLKPGSHWQDSLYREIAARFRLPILDGFQLIRGLVGWARMSFVDRMTARARKLDVVFGLPEHMSECIAWRSMRDSSLPSNALGVFALVDHLHFSRPIQTLFSTLLYRFMKESPSEDHHDSANPIDGCDNVIAATLNGGHLVERRNSFISRDLIALSIGETGWFKCPAGYRAFGLLLNTSQTGCFLQMRSAAGTKSFDLHYLPQHTPWVATMIPILDDIGDGDIEIKLLDDAQARNAGFAIPSTRTAGLPTGAELGELILVKSDWRMFVRHVPQEVAPVLDIDALPWAKPLVAEAIAQAALTTNAIEAQGLFIDASCDRFITTLVTKEDGRQSRVDHAKLLFALGKRGELARFLTQALQDEPEDAEELVSMATALQATQDEDSVDPDVLMKRARMKAESGAINEAEAIYEEGILRFPKEVRLWFAHASIAHQRRDWPEATRRWEIMKELFPMHEAWRMGLWISLGHCGRADEAERTIESTVEKFPGFVDAAAAYAQLPLAKGDLAEALRRLKSVRERFPMHLRNRKSLIEVLISEGEFTEARYEVDALVDDGLMTSELFHVALELADKSPSPVWIASVWDRLAARVPDRSWLTSQAVALSNRLGADLDCSFLLHWLPDAHGRIPSQDEAHRATGN